MSDTGRQSLTDKACSTVKPDSQKSTYEQASNWVKEKADSAASTLQPNSQKSGSQRAGDAVSGNSNENQESLANKAKNAVGLNDGCSKK